MHPIGGSTSWKDLLMSGEFNPIKWPNILRSVRVEEPLRGGWTFTLKKVIIISVKET
jgi:hypothetical protein